MRRPSTPALLLVLAVGLVVVGALVVVTAPPVTFGWFGCAPVEVGDAVEPWTAVWTTRTALGAGAVVVGALVAAVAGGSALGRRRRTV